MKIEVKSLEDGSAELWVNERKVAVGIEITCFTDERGEAYGVCTR